MSRKQFLGAAGRALSAIAMARVPAFAPRPLRAVAFDGYAVFDATTTIAVAESILPGKGRELVAQWRARMFQYQWLRTLAGRYVGFEQTAADALTYVLETTGVAMSRDAHDRLLDAQCTLTPWPGVASELSRMGAAGVRVALLSNMSDQMLVQGVQRGGLGEYFDATIFSTDRVRAAKPDARAYAMGTRELRAEPAEIGFVSFAPWDAAGASWFGYRSIWLNRGGAPAEKLDVTPDLVTTSLADVTSYVLASTK